MRENADLSRYVDRVKPFGETWSERRETMIERMRVQVLLFRELRSRIDEVTFTTPPEDVERGFQSFLVLAEQTLPSGTTEKHSELMELARQLAQQRQESESQLVSGMIPPDAPEAQDQQEKRALRFLELSADGDVTSFNSLFETVQSLREKYQKVRDLGEDVPSILNDFNTHTGRRLRPQSVARIHRTPFCITLVLQQNRREKGSLGLQYSGTPFAQAIDGPRVDETIEHEETHNFLDAFRSLSSRAQTPEEYLMSVVERLERKQKHESKDRPVRLPRVSALLDLIHEELIAEVRIAEEKQFFSPEEITEEYLSSLFRPQEEMDFLEYTKVLMTAGQDISAADQYLEEKIGEHAQDTLGPVFEEYQMKLRKAFIQLVENIRSAFFVAQRLESPQALNDVEALMVTLRPSQYHHIRSYLQSEHGESSEFFHELFRCLQRCTYSLESDERLCALLEQKPTALSLEEKDTIRAKVISLETVPSSLEEMRRFVEVYTRLLTILHLGDEDYPEFFAGTYFHEVIEHHLIDHPADLRVLHNALNDKEKRLFRETIEEYITDFLQEDLTRRALLDPALHKTETQAAIERMPLWAFVLDMRREDADKKS